QIRARARNMVSGDIAARQHRASFIDCPSKKTEATKNFLWTPGRAAGQIQRLHYPAPFALPEGLEKDPAAVARCGKKRAHPRACIAIVRCGRPLCVNVSRVPFS